MQYQGLSHQRIERKLIFIKLTIYDYYYIFTSIRVASYSAKALKCLLLDDALRSQVIVAGVPALLCTSLKSWTSEVLCLRELLGSLQTLAWDKQCVKSILQSDVISHLYDFSQQSDQEVSVLSLATLAVSKLQIILNANSQLKFIIIF